jgi:hypothetical protein
MQFVAKRAPPANVGGSYYFMPALAWNKTPVCSPDDRSSYTERPGGSTMTVPPSLTRL